MNRTSETLIAEMRRGALEVLVHNSHGPYRGLPRTAGWGYPEPYTRDLMISALGVLASGDERLVKSLRRVLTTLAANQSEHGHVPSLVHDPEDRGASDTTPLFIMAVALFRKVRGEPSFLGGAVERALTWMDYQSPDDRVIVGQLPTSDWRDEQWVLGYGLFVNTVVYAYLRLLGDVEKAERLRGLFNRFIVRGEAQHRHVHEGLIVPHKPYLAMWSYKIYSSERFDLLGNSFAVVSGLASRTRARAIVAWVEAECEALRGRGDLAVGLPPCFFPYIQPGEPDWRPRYESYNRPGEYHNGGIWPYVGGFYVAAAVAAGNFALAEEKLLELARVNSLVCNRKLAFGFNEWIRAQNGEPSGQEWQSWSAAMYLYAAECVRRREVLFFG